MQEGGGEDIGNKGYPDTGLWLLDVFIQIVIEIEIAIGIEIPPLVADDGLMLSNLLSRTGPRFEGRGSKDTRQMSTFVARQTEFWRAMGISPIHTAEHCGRGARDIGHDVSDRATVDLELPVAECRVDPDPDPDPDSDPDDANATDGKWPFYRGISPEMIEEALCGHVGPWPSLTPPRSAPSLMLVLAATSPPTLPAARDASP